ncbi:glycosyltransferase [Vibrio fluvialis]|uniref:glycosyltransferase n=1 Tax=Vibrio fluvialis TaxID=676 RepID=UPI001F28110F|nr:glycosyltransferase [Vibrio fluvialis]MCE7641499.1 glycosyltransferase [Vibrio fluvialis]
MKVLHIIPSIKIFGGAEKIVESLSEFDKGDVFEIYPDPSNIKIMDKVLFSIKSIVRLIKIRNDFDIFHVHLFPSLYISLALPKGKVVIHEHNTYNRRRNFRLLSIFERKIYRRAAAVISISSATKLSLEKWCGPLDNIQVIPNFTRFSYTPSPYVKKNSQSVKLLMVASFTEQKKHEYLVDAFRYLPDYYSLDLLGDGNKRPYIKSLITKYGLDDRITLYGNVDNVELFFKKADACVLLSNWEGFGLVVVEAASFNKITICSNVSGLSDVVSKEELLIENDMPARELANRIELIIDRITKNQDLFSDYCKCLSYKYSFDNYCNELFELYRKVIIYNKRSHR